jgi:predicted O-methyltransferase YrrM
MGNTISIDITRALAIDGWMSKQELQWLAEQAVEHRCIVEIGSYLGRSTRAMLDHCPGIVYAFDDWKGPRDVYLDKSERDKLFDVFRNNVVDHNDKIEIIKGDLSETYPYVEAVKPDMVFIDGSHEYEDVKRDILFWKDKLVPGGLICGHDIQLDTVQQAVTETIGEFEIAEDTTIWYKLV